MRAGLITHEPAPQLIVLAVEQEQENLALFGRRSAPFVVEMALEQLIQLTHAAAAAPAQLLQQNVFFHRASPDTAKPRMAWLY